MNRATVKGLFFRYGPVLSAGALIILCILVIAYPPQNASPEREGLPAAAATPEVVPPSIPEGPPLYPYIEILDSCGPRYDAECVNMREGPGEEYPVVAKLRRGIVLKVAEAVLVSGRTWYKIAVDEEIRYPERVTSEWYVAAEMANLIRDDGDHRLVIGDTATSSKHIIVDRSDQMLYAYDGETLFMETAISTGLELTPTPRGTFAIYKMTPSRYMQGPDPELGGDDYDLPGVPWNLYFTSGGAVIHGAYWHDSFGRPWSHGCVNVPLDKAKELYLWANIGTKVIVRD
ncbi:MAG: L,D-transpeptidase family protein [Minisyncoccia bacterium]